MTCLQCRKSVSEYRSAVLENGQLQAEVERLRAELAEALSVMRRAHNRLRQVEVHVAIKWPSEHLKDAFYDAIEMLAKHEEND